MTAILERFALENAGSPNMAVDGSGGSIPFTIDLSSIRGFDIRVIELYIEDSGVVNNYLGFMSGSALGTGVDFSTTSQARAFSASTIKSNRDLIRLFGNNAKFSLRDIGNRNSFIGTFIVPPGGLVLSPTDTIVTTIADDLKVLEFMSLVVTGVVQ